MAKRWYKNHPAHRVWWLDNGSESKGEWLFSFDRERVYSLFADYPDRLSPEEKRIFDAENPRWAEFFADRS